MNSQQRQLRKELRQAGASAAEINELLPIAANLSLLRPKIAESAKEARFQQGWLRRALKPLAFSLSGLALGMFLVVISQAALPTSVLFPVQKLSDSVSTSIDPSYRATVMMRRAQQVNTLVKNHANTHRILATLADYTTQASAYKSTAHTSYAAFEYCKTNLQQASTAATPAVKQAIAISLKSLANS